MLDEQEICHCAQTLAGIKTAGLFSCIYTDRQGMLNHVRELRVWKGVWRCRFRPKTVYCYRKCTDIYCKLCQERKSNENLTISV